MSPQPSLLGWAEESRAVGPKRYERISDPPLPIRSHPDAGFWTSVNGVRGHYFVGAGSFRFVKGHFTSVPRTKSLAQTALARRLERCPIAEPGVRQLEAH